MGRYVISRLVRWIPSVFILLLLVYALVYFGAGDPIKLIFLQAPGDVAYDPARVEAIREAAGLNRPFLVQFWDYIMNVAQGNFGNSRRARSSDEPCHPRRHMQKITQRYVERTGRIEQHTRCLFQHAWHCQRSHGPGSQRTGIAGGAFGPRL